MERKFCMKTNNKKLEYKNYSVVDIFCGVGGLTNGFVNEEFDVKAGIDFDESCKFAFESNNGAKFLHKDVTKLKPLALSRLFGKGKKRILVGCAPCQPFSVYNAKNNPEGNLRQDNKWKLLYSFGELVEKTKPEVISMENVPQLMEFNKGKVFNDFVNKLTKSGYYVWWKIVNAQDYGVPQRRKRLILLGSKLGEIELIEPTHKKGTYVTVRDAIGGLPPVEDGIAHPNDPVHRARKLSDLNKRRIQATTEGGFWRDWDESLQLECHKKDAGKSFRSVYGRMKWDDVSPTMTTYCTGLGNGRFGHPEQDRAITLREAALLQSFPDNYKFIDPQSPISAQTIARHIGNAVPVGLGIAIAKSIKKHIEEIGASK